MGDNVDLIYDLRADVVRVRQVQEASMHRPGYGFPTTPYLFGSDEWWAAIDIGAIERHRLEGVITAVYYSGHGDYPEFRMRTPDGSERPWTRQGDVTRYVEGLGVQVDYVTLARKPEMPSAQLGPTADVVVAIRIERSDERTPLYKGYRGSVEPDPAMLHEVHSFPPSDDER